MTRLFLFTIIVLSFIPFFEELRLGKLKFSKRRAFIMLGILIALIIISAFNVKVNGECVSGKKPEQLVLGVKEAYCVRTCYCDGIVFKNMCLGKWRYVCPIDR